VRLPSRARNSMAPPAANVRNELKTRWIGQNSRDLYASDRLGYAKRTMARKTTEKPSETATTSEAKADSLEGDSAIEALRALEPGNAVVVQRITPSYAAGYLGRMEIGTGGDETEVIDRIKSEYGGGRYRLVPQRRKGAAYRFAGGKTIIIDIAGRPMFDGQTYDAHGRLKGEDKPAPPQPNPVQVIAQPSPQNNDALLTLLQTLLANRDDGKALDTVGLVRSIMEVKTDSVGDPLGQVDRVLQLAERLSDRKRNDDDDDDVPRRGSSFEDMLPMMMMKFLSGDSGAKAPPPPAYYPPPVLFVTPPVPGAMFDPRSGSWVHPQHVMSRVPEAAKSTPNRNASPGDFGGSTVVGSDGDDDDDDDDSDDEPYTADEAFEIFENMPDDEKSALLSKLMGGGDIGQVLDFMKKAEGGD